MEEDSAADDAMKDSYETGRFIVSGELFEMFVRTYSRGYNIRPVTSE